MNNYYKWMIPTYSDKRVSSNDCLRVSVAKEQTKMTTVDRKSIIDYVNEFIKLIGMDIIENPEIDLISNPIIRGSYTRIKNDYGLDDKKDIVWMKFTKDNYLGVVAVGNDINFNRGNSSGKILTALGKEWDESFLLLFPLKNIPNDLNIHLIESGIGNYLISKNVPILDYYSHNL